MEEELEARLKRHHAQLEYDAKLQSLREQELQLLVEDAKEKLANTQRRFQAEEERKRLAFEAEERRKEEIHEIQIKIMKKQYE